MKSRDIALWKAAACVLLLVGAFLAGYLAGELRRSAGPGPSTDPATGAEPGSGPSGADPAELLGALGYTAGTLDEDSGRSGVLVHEPGSAPGVDFYTSLAFHGARLIDEEGRVLHTWTHEWGPWQHSHLFPNGDVLTVVQDQRLFELDEDSRLRWSLEGRFHHDVFVDEDGRILALRRERRIVERIHPRVPTLVDLLCVVSPDGVELERHSLVDVMLDSPYAYLLPRVRPPVPAGAEGEFDVLHTNHVEVFDGSLADRSPLFARGNVLLSMRHVNSILILDGRTLEVLWLWGPSNVLLQHHPTLLPNGHVLLFNNGARRSAVVELDPLSLRVVWEYRHEGFFSATRGSVQRLRNGNTLVTESDAGYVFEVTPDGRTVWEFANPDVSPEGIRSSIWRMKRFDRESLEFLGH